MLDVHHVNYRNLFDVKLLDLLALCRSCHKEEHRTAGQPRRVKTSYWNYFPGPALIKIKEQRPFVSNSLSRKERLEMKERLMRQQIAGTKRT
jgi:5-methylcytosine-specific restriction endonuclease McrA